MYDAVVVGGGPAGSKVAQDLAHSMNILVLEEHASSGVPMQCAGLVTDNVIKMSGVSPDVLNTINTAKVIFPDGRSILINPGHTIARVIDRIDLDRKLAMTAISAGAEFRYSEKYLSHSLGRDVSVRTTAGCYICRAIIGADGWNSRVSMSLGNNTPKEYLRGVQIDAKTDIDDSNTLTIFLGSRYAPGFFVWEIPCKEYTRIGLCVSQSAGPPIQYLKCFLKYIGCVGDNIQKLYSGKIPIGGRPKTYGDKCLLIGDAAGQVKPISAGGLYPMFIAAPYLVKTLISALDVGDLSHKKLSKYETFWRRDIGREMYVGWILRRLSLMMDDNDFNIIYDYISHPSAIDILKKIDIDHPSDTFLRLIFSHPTFFSIPFMVFKCLI